MIVFRRATDRQHVEVEGSDAWLTFSQREPTTIGTGFGNLVSLEEIWLAPGATALREQDMAVELLTYVQEGNVTHEVESNGASAVIRSGEFHLLTLSSRATRRETNTSADEVVHMYQVCLRASSEPVRPQRPQQQRFSAARRRGHYCLVASRDAEGDTLRLDHHARIYSALLEPGQHVVHEMSAGRSVWMHLVQGVVSIGDLLLISGDGLGVRDQRGISVTTRHDSEVLLVDLLDPCPPAPSTVTVADH